MVWGGIKNFFVGGSSPTQGIPMRPGPYGYANPGDYDRTVANAAYDAEGAQGRQAAQMQATQLDGGMQNQSRQGQMDVTNRLGAIASGQQRGAGEMAVNRQVGQATAGQLAAARSARGANAAMAYRNAARNQADLQLAGAAQARQAQMADQQGANQQLAGIYGQMRGQDIDYASQNAQLGQQANQANLSAQLQQRQMNDAYQQAMLDQQFRWQQQPISNALQAAQVNASAKGGGLLGNMANAAGVGLAGAAGAGILTGGSGDKGNPADDAAAENPDGLMDPYGNSGGGGGPASPGTTGTGAPIGGGGAGTGQTTSGLTMRTATPQYNYQLGARYRY